MRGAWFHAVIKVTDQYLRYSPTSEFDTKQRLWEELDGELRGPRGGRYRPVGDLVFVGKAQIDDDWMMNRWSFMAKRYGQYVRPVRRA